MRLILAAILLLGSSTYSNADANCQRKRQIVCYWGSWSVYRPDIGQFTTENIDPSLCTTLVYTFAGLGLNSEIESLDPWTDFDLRGYSNFTGLKEDNPCLKTTLALGGWNEGSIKYSVMAWTAESRKRFAENVLKFLVYYGFDGLDLDWEYPTTRGGIPEDGANYAALLEVIKETLSPWGFTLTIAVPIDDSLIGTGYDISAISKTVDYVHLMAYDYALSSSSNVTGLSSPLSAIKGSVSKWLNAGLPSKKLIIGIPTYGRTYILLDDDLHNVGDPVAGIGEPGDFTREAGFLAYYELLDFVQDPFLYMKVVETDDTNYAYGSMEWFTYETEHTVRTKAQYAVNQNLGGVMIWSLETDDFRGLHGKRYPLLSAINQVINENESK